MNKKKLIILFFVLTILLCISFSLFSSTYAKYHTNSSSYDEGRVAFWGVDIDVDSDKLFDSSYKLTDDTIVISSTLSVLAPGTSGSTVVNISGKPEVSSKFNLEFIKISDVFLKQGQYLNLSTDDPDKKNDQFLLANDYYPLVYTLSVKEGSNPVTIIKTGTLEQIETEFSKYIEENYKNRVFSAGEQLDTTFTISWSWASNLNNQADSWLGITSGGVTNPALVQNIDYSVVANYRFLLTVIQVD